MLLLAVLVVTTSACFDVFHLRPELRAPTVRRDAIGLLDALERMIDEQRARPNDRAAAYEAVQNWEQRTAAYAYARAVLAGRLAQVKGLTAVGLVREMERWARYSIRLDRDFRDGAATRALGTLYVLAPASLLTEGDSETGLEMLEELLQRYPGDPRNHLRVAEAYLSLDDPDPALSHLCVCRAQERALGMDDRRLLTGLVDLAGGVSALACAARPPPEL